MEARMKSDVVLGLASGLFAEGYIEWMTSTLIEVDLSYAMVSKPIAYEESCGKQKTCATAIWTSFGPHALFHACLDLKRSKFQDPWLRPGPHVAAHMHRARARSHPPSQFLVQDEKEGPLILRKAPASWMIGITRRRGPRRPRPRRVSPGCVEGRRDRVPGAPSLERLRHRSAVRPQRPESR
jgi:hypothetical protein